jgi:hypothetical protein
MKLQSVEDAKRFVTAGKATFTLSSTRTGARFTYKVSAIKDAPARFFVALLTGPDNTNDYAYIGLIDNLKFRRTAKSKASEDAPSIKAIGFFCEQVLARDTMPACLEVRHEGRCGRCHHPLTTPESIDRGIGPDCAEKMGLL